MELLLSFLLGIVTTLITEWAKKYNVPPRMIIAAIAGLLAVIYMLLSLIFSQQALDHTLGMLGLILSTWYSTATVLYEWGIKMLKPASGK